MTKLTIQERMKNYKPLDIKDKMKFNFIVEHLKDISENHIKNISQLQFPKQEWKSEVEYTCWLTPKIKTYFLCYIDLESAQYFGDLKNVFGNPIPTKKKGKINGWTYTKKKCPTRPFHSDQIQIALYQQCVPKLQPFLSYASNCDHVLFTPANCEELQPENLKKHLNELTVYQLAWQKKLEIADGDINKMAWLCQPDYSEIQKQGFWWKGVDPAMIERFKGYYQC